MRAMLSPAMQPSSHICSQTPPISKLFFQKGAKFRPSAIVTEPDKHHCYAAVEAGMHRFVEDLNRKYKLNSLASFGPWRTAVLFHIRNALFSCQDSLLLGNATAPAYTRHDREAMDTLLEKFMCCPTDKCAQNLSFVCKKHAAELELADLHRGGQENPTYLAVTEPMDEGVQNLAQLVQQHGYVCGSPALPVYTFMPKMHKDIIDSRFLSLS